jgi:5-hydroxyisourate hydrolase-like protein (transthyretin family)
MKTSIIFALTMAIANSLFAQEILYCSGTVRFSSGAPAAGVRVEYYPGHHNGAGRYTEVRTDANGRYKIIGPKDAGICTGEIIRTNSIIARDTERSLAAIQAFNMATTNVDLVLQPAITLSGSVKTAEGTPVVDAEVRLAILANSTLALLGGQPTKVNELGEFLVPALPQGREYDVWGITAKGYGSGNAMVTAKDTQTNHYEFPSFTLIRADHKIAGRIVDEAGKPLAGAEVYFMGKGQPQNLPMNSTNADGEGRFHFEAVCEAPLYVYADYHDPVDPSIFTSRNGGMSAQPGDTNIVIRLPALSK